MKDKIQNKIRVFFKFLKKMFKPKPLLLAKLIVKFIAGIFIFTIFSFGKVAEYKNVLVYRLFWGRGNLYKKILHVFFVILTISILLTGLRARIKSSTNQYGVLPSVGEKVGDVDLLEQGADIQTVLEESNKTNFRIWSHLVTDADGLDNLAKQYGVTKETIKWANEDKIGWWEERVVPGDILLIPEVNGVLYKVKDGDTLDGIMSKVIGGDKFDVIEINSLYTNNNEVVAGSNVLIPGASKTPPPPPLPQPTYYFGPPTTTAFLPNSTEVNTLNGIAFVDPLSHPSCGGYSWNRGYTAWHNGVDLGKGGGCPIRAAGPGIVTTAGWGQYGEGYHVKIDHGGGVTTVYYHGDGNIWVTPGTQVYAGQEIMNMGCTGNCTGTHLHLGLRINGVYYDPSPYIPYWRPF